MADALTHVFLPLTAVYVLRPELFPAPRYLLLGGVGLFSDVDKFLGAPGVLHSLVTLVPLCVAILVVERWLAGKFEYGPLLGALVLSHLLLDVVDGGPVPLLFPVVETGIGFQYPVSTVFGCDPLGVCLEGPLVTLRTAVPRPGYNTYGLIDGVGVANSLLFLTVYLGVELETRSD